MTWKINYPRIVPARRPAGHQPRAPRWSAAFDEPTAFMTSDYLAVQTASEHDPAAIRFRELATESADPRTPFAPERWELLSHRDEAGQVNLIHLGYWKDPLAHAKWLRAAALPRWFDALDANGIGFGAWHEVVQVPIDRLETVCSKEGWEFGLARCDGIHMELMTMNGYFGAARDRLPVSAIDELEAPTPHSPGDPGRSTLGRRIRAECGHNTAVIRSGQFWSTASGEQLADYEQELEPKLLDGMRHLTEHKDEEGVLSLRVVRNLDTRSFAPMQETSSIGYFHCLEPLEEWARVHATHAAIYEHAIEKQRQYGDDRSVITWHEVFVLPRSTAFEYVNCHPDTGLLPSAQTLTEVIR